MRAVHAVDVDGNAMYVAVALKHRPRLIACCYHGFGRIFAVSYRRLVSCGMRSFREVDCMVI